MTHILCLLPTISGQNEFQSALASSRDHFLISVLIDFLFLGDKCSQSFTLNCFNCKQVFHFRNTVCIILPRPQALLGIFIPSDRPLVWSLWIPEPRVKCRIKTKNIILKTNYSKIKIFSLFFVIKVQCISRPGFRHFRRFSEKMSFL